MPRSLLTLSILILSFAASPTFAEVLPDSVIGIWDTSTSRCEVPGTSITKIEIAEDMILTFGGDAIVRDIVRTGPITYIAADFLQIEGQAEIGLRERTYFRFTQREGPDQLNVVWKDVFIVDLVRCNDAPGRN